MTGNRAGEAPPEMVVQAHDCHVMVRMDPAMKQALQADAEANERTVSQTVRLAIRRYIELRRWADELESHTEEGRRRDIDNGRAPGAMA